MILGKHRIWTLLLNLSQVNKTHSVYCVCTVYVQCVRTVYVPTVQLPLFSSYLRAFTRIGTTSCKCTGSSRPCRPSSASARQPGNKLKQKHLIMATSQADQYSVPKILNMNLPPCHEQLVSSGPKHSNRELTMSEARPPGSLAVILPTPLAADHRTMVSGSCSPLNKFSVKNWVS